MFQSKPILLGVATIINISILLSGCTMLQTSKKSDVGPIGTFAAERENPPLSERFMSPPSELYDLETATGVVFEGIMKNDWLQASTGVQTLQKLWPQAKALVGDKKGVSEASTALEELTTSVSGKKDLESYESLNTFMASISNIGKSYKLSPISDIIGVDNAIRRVAFYVTIDDWHKAATKMKELDNTWGQAKPSMEGLGMWGKVTATHSIIKQMKDAVDAENKASFKSDIARLNENMADISDYYRGK